ncbi:hypothetical protein ACQPZF_09470 [Actinosynnema sp. CS-041913]|uniref:hypothetical protein n=1 Tax=Actinosynnema sp. CS-041913 TaxID=3239917 RepID=UPI003D920E8B
MRNVKVAVVLAAFALAGCSGDGPSTSPPFSSTPTTPSPSTSATAPTSPTTTLSPTGRPTEPPPQSSAPPLPGPTAVPSAQIDGSTLSDIYKREAWLASDGRTVQVFSLAGGCKRASAEITAQSADQVQIALVTTYYPPTGGACTEELYLVPVNVVLDAPLGQRRIVLEAREQTA